MSVIRFLFKAMTSKNESFLVYVKQELKYNLDNIDWYSIKSFLFRYTPILLTILFPSVLTVLILALNIICVPILNATRTKITNMKLTEDKVNDIKNSISEKKKLRWDKSKLSKVEKEYNRWFKWLVTLYMLEGIRITFIQLFMMPFTKKVWLLSIVQFYSNEEQEVKETIVPTDSVWEDTTMLQQKLDSVKMLRNQVCSSIQNQVIRDVASRVNKAVSDNIYNFTSSTYNKKETELVNEIKAIDKAVLVTNHVEVIDWDRHFRIEIENDDWIDLSRCSWMVRVPYNQNKGWYAQFVYDTTTTKYWFEYMREEKEVVKLKVPDFIDYKEKNTNQSFKSKLSAVSLNTDIWVDTEWHWVFIDPTSAESVHLLIAWWSGGWKSKFIEQIIFDWIENLSPEQIRFDIIDPKREFASMNLDTVPHVDNIASWPKEINKAVAIVRNFVKEMNERYDYLTTNKYQKLSQYNEKNPNSIIPWKILLVDEIGWLTTMMENAEREDFLKQISIGMQMARAAWMIIVLATQNPDSNNIPSKIRNNFGSAVWLSTRTHHQTTWIFWTFPTSALPHEDLNDKKWHAVVVAWSIDKELRWFFIKDEDRDRIVSESINKYWERVIKEIELEEEIEEPTDIVWLAKKDLEEYSASQLKKDINWVIDIPVITKNLTFKEELFNAIRVWIDTWKISKSIFLEHTQNIPSSDAQQILVELDTLWITKKDWDAINAHRRFLISDLETIQQIIKNNLQLI